MKKVLLLLLVFALLWGLSGCSRPVEAGTVTVCTGVGDYTPAAYPVFVQSRDGTVTDSARKFVADCVKGYERPLYFHWIIELDGRPIGSLSVNEALFSWELGYCIARSHWGRGLVSEAVAGVFHYLFGEMGFRRIFALHSDRNPGSGRVMEKNGMVREGLLRQHMGLRDGSFTDLLFYGILAEDWTVWEAEHPMEVRVEQP